MLKFGVRKEPLPPKKLLEMTFCIRSIMKLHLKYFWSVHCRLSDVDCHQYKSASKYIYVHPKVGISMDFALLLGDHCDSTKERSRAFHMLVG